MSTPRDDVLRIFRSAVAAVHGTDCVERFLTVRQLQGEVYVLALGKAAEAMLQGARAALGEQLHSALLVTKPGHVTRAIKAIEGVTVMEAGHPVPDAASLRAGQGVLDFIDAAPRDAQLLFLISGGTSSLVEVLPPGVSLNDLQRLNQWLLDSGLDIHDMNALRKRLSCIKGGRLAGYLHGRNVLQVLISDVPGDNPADIGSGLLVPEEEGHISEVPLPEWLQVLLQHSPLLEQDPSCFHGIDTRVIASLDDALTEWRQCTVTVGRKVEVRTTRETIRGLAVDIDTDGGLIVELSGGGRQKVIYGDCFHQNI